MAKHSKAAELLKVLAGAVNVPAAPESVMPREVKSQATKKSKAEHTDSKSAIPIRGKAIQFYLHAEDERIIRELAAWLAPQRKRINDSLVIKSALRAVKTGHEFLAAYDEAVQIDGRTRQNRVRP